MRPTADRVREALFARLPDLANARVLDLYAGTGALGIEAISRGGREVVFVERSARALGALRRNLSRLDIADRARVVRAEVRDAIRRLAREGAPFDLVLADPPYEDEGVADALSRLAEAELLGPGGLLVVERSRRHPLAAIPGLVAVESRRYGDTVLAWLTPEPGPGGARDPAQDPADSTGRADR